jgi:hypothetical protein
MENGNWGQVTLGTGDTGDGRPAATRPVGAPESRVKNSGIGAVVELGTGQENRNVELGTGQENGNWGRIGIRG